MLHREAPVRGVYQKLFHMFRFCGKTAVFRDKSFIPVVFPFRQKRHGMNPGGLKYPAGSEVGQAQRPAFLQQFPAQRRRSGIAHPFVGHHQVHHPTGFQNIHAQAGEHVPVIHAGGTISGHAGSLQPVKKPLVPLFPNKRRIAYNQVEPSFLHDAGQHIPPHSNAEQVQAVTAD